MTTIADNLQEVHRRIERACSASARDVRGVTLLAVSKTFGPDAVAAAVDAGQRVFGENYIQEGVEKVQALRASHPDADLCWHCIGPVQSNKTRLVAAHFDWVQSVDRLKIAQRLSEQRPSGMPPLQVCLQVNVDGIPEPSPDVDTQRALFGRIRTLFDALNAQGLGLDTLSLGMSDDLDAAVAAGSTMVRVGRAVFGGRPGKA
jgi:PLP dependent protein